jgi:hypothetical protein
MESVSLIQFGRTEVVWMNLETLSELKRSARAQLARALEASWPVAGVATAESSGKRTRRDRR